MDGLSRDLGSIPASMVISTGESVSDRIAADVKCSTRTDEIRNVEPRWTRIADILEVIVAVRGVTRVNQFALCQQDKFVKEGHDIAARLMDGENDRTIIVSRKCHQAVHHAEGVVSVQSAGGFVEEED